jgi:RNA methyltransferase, TrmH family
MTYRPHRNQSQQDTARLMLLSASQHQHIRALQKRSEREIARQCVIEGEHLCNEYLSLVQSGRANRPYSVVLPDKPSPNAQARLYALADAFTEIGASVYETSERKFAMLTDAQTPQGILAVIDYPDIPLETDRPFIILDSIADPGNVGTIIRTAEWFGVRNILLGEGCADRFNPKTLRATMGAIFRCAVLSRHLAETLRRDFAHYRFYGASLQGSQELSALNVDGCFGIVLGSEAHGISPEVQALLHETFCITRAETSEAESLNVAVAAGIILHHLGAVGAIR